MSLVVDDLFWEVLVFFIDGCSADSCGFGVLVRGSELRVFLLHHLGQSSRDCVHILSLGQVACLGHSR